MLIFSAKHLLSYNVSMAQSLHLTWVLCRLKRPAVLLHLAAPKMADKHGRGPSSDTVVIQQTI